MMTRRIFLKNGSLALVSLGFTPAFIARAAEASQTRQKILIAVFQRGAVDGLNMVVPFGEKAYYDARPSIAIPKPGQPDGALDLDGFFGLHPRMAPLVPMFQRGELAIVHASGSHDVTRSHFDGILRYIQPMASTAASACKPCEPISRKNVAPKIPDVIVIP
jgi:uncharacterized protein (DUF1501 family)